MLKITAPRVPEKLDQEKNLSILLLEGEKEISGCLFRNNRIEDVMQERVSIDASLLANCSFMNCRLKKGQFTDVIFQNCDLSNLVFTGSAFTRVEFRGCKLTGTRFPDANLYQVLFTECRGEYINLSGSKQREVCYRDSHLRGAAMDGCSFTNVSFQACNLTEAEFYQTTLKGIDFTGSEIAGVRVNLLPATEWKGAVVTSVQAVELARLLGVVIRD